jgi:hypothetical protein
MLRPRGGVRLRRLVGALLRRLDGVGLRGLGGVLLRRLVGVRLRGRGGVLLRRLGGVRRSGSLLRRESRPRRPMAWDGLTPKEPLLALSRCENREFMLYVCVVLWTDTQACACIIDRRVGL